MGAAALTLVALLVKHAVSAVPPEVLEQWRVSPEGCPHDIVNEQQVNYMDRHVPYVSPILRDGFGNMMFQLATAHVLAKQRNVTCIVAWCDHVIIIFRCFFFFFFRFSIRPSMTTDTGGTRSI